jgi:hypothetical protein
MNLQDDPIDNSSTVQAVPSEDSCILVEEDISIVDLANDTKLSESRDEVADTDSTVDEEVIDDKLPCEFQVIDEVGSSQEEEAENGEVLAGSPAENGVGVSSKSKQS